MASPSIAIPESIAVTRRPRIALLRCCRPAQFAAAVARTREGHPDAELVALSHAGHRDALRAAGVDAVVEVPGTRFGVLRLPPWHLWRLRAQRFDHVVIPQMTDVPEAHVNLYWLAVGLGAAVVTIQPPDAPARVLPRRTLARQLPGLSCRGVLERLDVPLLILLLLAARCVPRRRAGATARRPRVLHVIPSLGVGGAQRQLAAVVDATPPAEFDVEVVVFTAGDGDFARSWFSRRDVPVTVLTSWPRLTGMALEIARLCRDRQVDVVHSWLCLANAVGGAGARLAGVPRVVSAVRSLSLWKRTWYRRWWYRPVDAVAARAADVVTVNARAVVADYSRWTWTSARRITVVHNGLDPRSLEVDMPRARQALVSMLGIDETAEVIGTVGRLAPEKGHAVFLRMVRDLRRTRPRLQAVLVGDGQLRAELHALASTLGLDGVVYFVGERTDVPQLVAGFDLFVLPSVIEGFPNALLEAVLIGVPACATRVGGCPDVLDDDATLFTVDDVDDAVRVVGAALEDGQARRRRASKARDRARALFSAARTTATWHRIYREPVSEVLQG